MSVRARSYPTKTRTGTPPPTPHLTRILSEPLRHRHPHQLRIHLDQGVSVVSACMGGQEVCAWAEKECVHGL